MLAENAPAGSPLKRYADNVLSGANRASGLVEQILSYSRSQRGKRAPVELGRIVAETLELVRGSLPTASRWKSSGRRAKYSSWAMPRSSTRSR